MGDTTVKGKVRDNHIVKDDVTSRDLLGFVRGRCLECLSCGKYIIVTKEKYYKKGVCILVSKLVGPSQTLFDNLIKHHNARCFITYAGRCSPRL